jgi:tetratricopeptide (TPR) repeat protein
MLGSAYESRGETKLAITEYKAALSKDKKSAEALFFLGNAYFGAENLDKSEYFYKKALKVSENKQRGLIHNNLAWIYIKRGGNFSEAEKLCKKAIKIDPERSSIYLDTLGVVYFFQEEYELADQVLLEALEKIAAQRTGIREEILTHLSEVHNAREK